MAFESWPPMSMMVLVAAFRKCAPIAWQEISVTMPVGTSS